MSSKTRVVIAFALIAVSAVSAIGFTSLLPGTGGNISKFSGVQLGSGGPVCTTAAPDFVDMPGMSFEFTTASAGSVLVLFSGQFSGNGRAALRLTIDGQTAGVAHAIGSDTSGGLNTFGFNAFETVSAGTHTAKAMWHTFPTGKSTCVEERSLVVLQS